MVEGSNSDALVPTRGSSWWVGLLLCRGVLPVLDVVVGVLGGAFGGAASDLVLTLLVESFALTPTSTGPTLTVEDVLDTLAWAGAVEVIVSKGSVMSNEQDCSGRAPVVSDDDACFGCSRDRLLTNPSDTSTMSV